MRNVIAIIVGLVVTVVIAWMLCELVHLAEGLPGFLCTVIWVVAILGWLLWSFGGYLSDGTRAP